MEPQCSPIACLIVGRDQEMESKQTSRNGSLFLKIMWRKERFVRKPLLLLVELSGKLLPLTSLPYSAKKSIQKISKAIFNIESSQLQNKHGPSWSLVHFPTMRASRELHENTSGNWYVFGFLFAEFLIVHIKKLHHIICPHFPKKSSITACGKHL